MQTKTFDKDKVLQNKQDGFSQYASDFDYLMHDYILKQITPYFKGKHIAELGSYKGEMTKKLLKIFPEVTAIEIMDELCVELKKIPSKNLSVVCSDFTKFKDYSQFSDILSSHSLEHIQDHIKILQHLKDNKAASTRVHIIVPNANSLSRQIAVKMGLMEHEEDVTEFEKSIGHFHTFTRKKLSKDLESVGFKIISSGGIMPKIYSNGQYDKSLSHNIIDIKYLDACSELSDKHPELCASIYFICE